MEIKYNQPFEVTEKQYHRLMSQCAGVVAGRKDASGKYYIKVWIMSWLPEVKKVIAATA